MTDWRLSAACLGADQRLFFPRDENRRRSCTRHVGGFAGQSVTT